MNSTRNLVQAFFNSERRYFCAGAENQNAFGGTFSVIRGLSSHPGGCVLHGIENIPRNLDDWLDGVKTLFRSHDSSLLRVYMDSAFSVESSRQLEQRGFRQATEIGYGRSLLDTDDGESWKAGGRSLRIREPREISVVERTAQYRSAYLELLNSLSRSPDGHAMIPEQYASLEDVKISAGYMLPYLMMHRKKALGAGNLEMFDGFARIKNIVVHPQSRGRRIGSSLVSELTRIASSQGARFVGAFAIDGYSPAIGMYLNCQFHEVCRQVEWTQVI